MLLVNLGGITTNDIVPVCKLPRRLCITSIYLINAGAITGDSNYVVLTLKTGTTTLAILDTQSTGEGDVADNVPKAFGLDGAAATEGHREVAIDLDADSVLLLTYAETGTVGLTAAQLQINGYWR